MNGFRFQSFIAFLVIASLLVSYAGIPVYTMICKLDGHIAHALLKEQIVCEHKNYMQKSCCDKEPADAACEQPEPSNDCCDFNSKVYKLDKPFTRENVDLISVLLPLVIRFDSEPVYFCNVDNIHVSIQDKSPPERLLIEHSPSFISVFQI